MVNEAPLDPEDGRLQLQDLDALAPLSPDTLPFWEAAQTGSLSLPRCLRCKRLIAYPRGFCPHCQNDQVEWETHDGRGRVWTFTVVHHSRQAEWQAMVPYVVAVVELEPGARLTGRILDCDPSVVRIGMPVQVDFAARADGIRIPVFRAANAAAHSEVL